jgi:hypothetical protein
MHSRIAHSMKSQDIYYCRRDVRDSIDDTVLLRSIIIRIPVSGVAGAGVHEHVVSTRRTTESPTCTVSVCVADRCVRCTRYSYSGLRDARDAPPPVVPRT